MITCLFIHVLFLYVFYLLKEPSFTQLTPEELSPPHLSELDASTMACGRPNQWIQLGKRGAATGMICTSQHLDFL